MKIIFHTVIVLGLASAGSLGTHQAFAGPLGRLTPQNPPVSSTAAIIQICSGKTPHRFNTPLAAGSELQTGAESEDRCRVVLANGDVVHVGPGTSLRIGGQDQQPRINLEQGQAVVYALPAIEGRGQPLVVQTPAGSLELKTGKAGLGVAKGGATTVYLFNNAGRWKNARSETALHAGQLLRSDAAAPQEIAQGFEPRFTALVSPEVPAVQQALAHFNNKQMAAAKEQLSQVSAAFPYNAAATYYLGLIQLDAGDLAGASKQWKRYADVEPEKAKEKEVPRHLTLIVTEKIKQEVQEALKQEKELSQAAPEPKSIAVYPLTNKGSEKYRAVGKGLTAMVIADMAKVPDVKVLEREKIQRLLDEINLTESGLTVEEGAPRRGKILRAEKLVVGDYQVEGAKENDNE
jgi:TolA-binding protein